MHNVVRQIKNLLNCIMVELVKYLLKVVLVIMMVSMVMMHHKVQQVINYIHWFLQLEYQY